ncbi:ABC transporter permease [Blastococcus sp. SYSU D00820]
MTEQTLSEAPTAADATAAGSPAPRRPRTAGSPLLRWLDPRRISAVYVFLLLFAVFSLWIPDLFLTETTWRTLLNNQAVTALTALALVLPLAAGVFNLAVGAQVGAASILIAWLLVDAGMPVVPAIVLCLLSGVVIGLATALLVVRARIDSFIATLGVSSLLAAFITAISGGQQILGVPEEFAAFGRGRLFGITYPVYAVLVVALVLWYVLERTPAGRRVYGTGGNIEAARLAGVRTSRVVVGSLVACGLVAALAGMSVTATLANADPTIGPGYLLPAFTAAFLGSTQFRGGRFNVWGTVLAVYVLATGVKGLQLAGAPVWIPDAFNGAALLLAVGLAKMQGNKGRTSAIARLLRRRHAEADTAP